jgi:hypothetical protein
MLVSKLIEELKQCEPNAIVVMASDGEGNSYSPLADLGESYYIADSTWSGCLWNVADEEDEWDEEYEGEPFDPTPPDEAVPAVVIWPTN